MPNYLTQDQKAIAELKMRLNVLEKIVSDVSVFSLLSTTNEIRTLNTPFIVHKTRAALCAYTIELTITDAVNASVALWHGLGSPTILMGENKFTFTAGVPVGTVSSTMRQQLIGFVPANHIVQLITTGTGVVTLVNSIEVVLE